MSLYCVFQRLLVRLIILLLRWPFIASSSGLRGSKAMHVGEETLSVSHRKSTLGAWQMVLATTTD